MGLRFYYFTVIFQNFIQTGLPLSLLFNCFIFYHYFTILLLFFKILSKLLHYYFTFSLSERFTLLNGFFTVLLFYNRFALIFTILLFYSIAQCSKFQSVSMPFLA